MIIPIALSAANIYFLLAKLYNEGAYTDTLFTNSYTSQLDISTFLLITTPFSIFIALFAEILLIPLFIIKATP